MARSTVVSEGGKSVVDDYRSSDGTFLDVGMVRRTAVASGSHVSLLPF